jgi:hypothetical protein
VANLIFSWEQRRYPHSGGRTKAPIIESQQAAQSDVLPSQGHELGSHLGQAFVGFAVTLSVRHQRIISIGSR